NALTVAAGGEQNTTSRRSSCHVTTFTSTALALLYLQQRSGWYKGRLKTISDNDIIGDTRQTTDTPWRSGQHSNPRTALNKLTTYQWPRPTHLDLLIATVTVHRRFSREPLWPHALQTAGSVAARGAVCADVGSMLILNSVNQCFWTFATTVVVSAPFETERWSDRGRVGSERGEMSGATRSGHALSHVCVGFNCLVNRLGAPGHQLLTVVWLKPMLDTGMCNISYKIMSAALHGEGETKEEKGMAKVSWRVGGTCVEDIAAHVVRCGGGAGLDAERHQTEPRKYPPAPRVPLRDGYRSGSFSNLAAFRHSSHVEISRGMVTAINMRSDSDRRLLLQSYKENLPSQEGGIPEGTSWEGLEMNTNRWLINGCLDSPSWPHGGLSARTRTKMARAKNQGLSPSGKEGCELHQGCTGMAGEVQVYLTGTFNDPQEYNTFLTHLASLWWLLFLPPSPLRL
ncbi:hypothetical protein Bbelb_380690, partial [Branchiostoma belcheri]